MLLQAAKDNMYNFELVASTLSFSGTSVSDLEKRSAWECFEKFRAIYPEPQNIQLTGPNRNTAMNRLEKGNRLSVSSTSRLKPNTIVRQPRMEVRNHRYLNLFDVMKKSAKNREKSKSQGWLFEYVSDCLDKPAVKKPKDNLPTKTAINVPTPMDLSRLKAERDRALNQAMMAERQAQVIVFNL
jgi:chromatin modification-related protein VID21